MAITANQIPIDHTTPAKNGSMKDNNPAAGEVSPPPPGYTRLGPGEEELWSNEAVKFAKQALGEQDAESDMYMYDDWATGDSMQHFGKMLGDWKQQFDRQPTSKKTWTMLEALTIYLARENDNFTMCDDGEHFAVLIRLFAAAWLALAKTLALHDHGYNLRHANSSPRTFLTTATDSLPLDTTTTTQNPQSLLTPERIPNVQNVLRTVISLLEIDNSIGDQVTQVDELLAVLLHREGLRSDVKEQIVFEASPAGEVDENVDPSSPQARRVRHLARQPFADAEQEVASDPQADDFARQNNLNALWDDYVQSGMAPPPYASDVRIYNAAIDAVLDGKNISPEEKDMIMAGI